jgi:hypothetical protein
MFRYFSTPKFIFSLRFASVFLVLLHFASELIFSFKAKKGTISLYYASKYFFSLISFQIHPRVPGSEALKDDPILFYYSDRLAAPFILALFF